MKWNGNTLEVVEVRVIININGGKTAKGYHSTSQNKTISLKLEIYLALISNMIRNNCRSFWLILSSSGKYSWSTEKSHLNRFLKKGLLYQPKTNTVLAETMKNKKTLTKTKNSYPGRVCPAEIWCEVSQLCAHKSICFNNQKNSGLPDMMPALQIKYPRVKAAPMQGVLSVTVDSFRKARP